MGNLDRPEHGPDPDHGRADAERILIWHAQGIVMSDRQCGPDEAFAIMCEQARAAQSSIIDIAMAVAVAASVVDEHGHRANPMDTPDS